MPNTHPVNDHQRGHQAAVSAASSPATLGSRSRLHLDCDEPVWGACDLECLLATGGGRYGGQASGLAAIRLSVMARERDRWALGRLSPVEAGPVQGWWPRRGPATRVTRLGWHRITHKRGFADRGVGCRSLGGDERSVCASLSEDGDEGSPVQGRRCPSCGVAGRWLGPAGRVVHSERRNPRVCSLTDPALARSRSESMLRWSPTITSRSGRPCPTGRCSCPVSMSHPRCWLVSSWGAAVSGVPQVWSLLR